MSLRPKRPRTRRGVAFLLTLPLSLTLLTPGLAQEADEEPRPIDASAVYVASATAVLPKTITNDVPPTAICIVVPEICPPQLDPARDVARDTVGDVAEKDIQVPVQPIPPDTIALSVLMGTTRHQSAIRFDAPAPPAGEQITHFDLVLEQTQPVYDMDSPSFRRVILGLFQTIAAEDPQLVVEGLVDALQNEDPVDLSQKIGIEACPLLAPFEPSDAPQAQSDEQLPRDEDTGEPLIDCVLGAIGSYDANTQTWTFDLRFAAMAWAAGELDNHGVLLRPIGVQNLAYGDPDPTTSAQLTLDVTSAASITASAAPPAPPPPPDTDDETVSGTLSGGTGFAPGDPVPLGLPAAPSPTPDAPAVGAAPPVAAPSVVDGVLARGPIEQPWWMWLSVVAFAVGLWLAVAGFSGEVVEGGRQAGAMTRLLSRQSPTAGVGA